MIFNKNKNKAIIKVKTNRDFHILKILICSLFTLAPSELLFKNLNIQDCKYVYTLDESSIFNDLTRFCIDFDNTEKKNSIKNTAYNILKPILRNKNNYAISIVDKIATSDTLLLKSYLRKFKYNYYRYFLPVSDQYYNLPTNKEINLCAINTLFLLLLI